MMLQHQPPRPRFIPLGPAQALGSALPYRYQSLDASLLPAPAAHPAGEGGCCTHDKSPPRQQVEGGKINGSDCSAILPAVAFAGAGGAASISPAVRYGGTLGWMFNVVPTDPASIIPDPETHHPLSVQRCHIPEDVWRPQCWWGPGWGQDAPETPPSQSIMHRACTAGQVLAGDIAAHRGAGCDSHLPVPAATPGNKTPWEASPGMPGKPVAGFFHSRDPSWRTCHLEVPYTYCDPNFLGPGAERDALHSRGAGPSLPSWL